MSISKFKRYIKQSVSNTSELQYFWEWNESNPNEAIYINGVSLIFLIEELLRGMGDPKTRTKIKSGHFSFDLEKIVGKYGKLQICTSADPIKLKENIERLGNSHLFRIYYNYHNSFILLGDVGVSKASFFGDNAMADLLNGKITFKRIDADNPAGSQTARQLALSELIRAIELTKVFKRYTISNTEKEYILKVITQSEEDIPFYGINGGGFPVQMFYYINSRLQDLYKRNGRDSLKTFIDLRDFGILEFLSKKGYFVDTNDRYFMEENMNVLVDGLAGAGFDLKEMLAAGTMQIKVEMRVLSFLNAVFEHFGNSAEIYLKMIYHVSELTKMDIKEKKKGINLALIEFIKNEFSVEKIINVKGYLSELQRLVLIIKNIPGWGPKSEVWNRIITEFRNNGYLVTDTGKFEIPETVITDAEFMKNNCAKKKLGFMEQLGDIFKKVFRSPSL